MPVRPRDGGGGPPPSRTRLDTWHGSPTGTTASIPDWRDRRAALDRLKARRDHERICQWAHMLMPLDLYYGPRRWVA